MLCKSGSRRQAQTLLRLAQPLLEVVNGFYRRGVSFIEYCQVIADPIAQIDQAHHLAELAATLAVNRLVADAALLQDFAGHLVSS